MTPTTANPASVLTPFDPVLFGPNLLCALSAGAGVAEFLANHPEVRSLLVELPAQARAAFGKQNDIVLDTYPDPDDGSVWLNAAILTRLGVEEALARLDVLDRDWWLARAGASHEFVITLDFRG